MRFLFKCDKSPHLSRKLLTVITAVILLAASLLVASLLASCGEIPSQQPISTISEKWLAIKKEFINPTAGLENRIDDFRLTFNNFFSSSVGSLYQTHRPQGIQYLEVVNSAADRLKTAIQNNDNQALYLTAAEIDASLDSLLRIDKSLSNAVQRNSFFLFLFFSLLVITIILILVAQYAKIERTENRERQSIAFSRETIKAQEQERSRIARELHDTVAHDILQLSIRTEIMNKEADTAKRNLLCDEVVSGQREIMKRIRDICENLIPPDFQRRRLGDALQSLCYNFWRRTNIECQIKIQKDFPFTNRSPYIPCRGSRL
ncbi:sensor histidine kinase [Treponema sp. R80B11-R83G3]